MVWRHYHKAVTQKQAKAFWKIEPRLQIEVENHSLGSLNASREYVHRHIFPIQLA
jgi:hypothetical protein